MAGTVGYGPGDCAADVQKNALACVLSGLAFGKEKTAPETFGEGLNNVSLVFQNYPWFLTTISFVAGLIIAVLMLFDLREYIDNPKDKPLYLIVMKFFTAAFFFAIPTVYRVLQDTISGGALTWNPGRPPPTIKSGGGADEALLNFVKDIETPMTTALTVFCFIAGITLVFIGIRRLMNAANEGAQAPLGRGTITTFFIAAILLSLFYFMRVINASIFGMNDVVYVGITEKTAKDLGITDREHLNAIFWSVLTFMQIIGAISIIRGLFIFRAIGEGAGNASPMAGFTHVIGGAIAVNLGQFVLFAQNTFNVGKYLSPLP
jgi:hypothetical protein